VVFVDKYNMDSRDKRLNKVDGTEPMCLFTRTKKTWQDSVSADLSAIGIDPQDAQDCTSYRKTNPAESGNNAIERRWWWSPAHILDISVRSIMTTDVYCEYSQMVTSVGDVTVTIQSVAGRLIELVSGVGILPRL